MKARAIVGSGENSRRSGPGSHVRLLVGAEKGKKKCEDNRWDGHKKKRKNAENT